MPNDTDHADGASDPSTIQDATAASRLTHYDPRCVGGCIAVCTAIGCLVRGEKDEAIARAAEAGGHVSDDVRRVIERGAPRPTRPRHPEDFPPSFGAELSLPPVEGFSDGFSADFSEDFSGAFASGPAPSDFPPSVFAPSAAPSFGFS